MLVTLEPVMLTLRGRRMGQRGIVHILRRAHSIIGFSMPDRQMGSRKLGKPKDSASRSEFGAVHRFFHIKASLSDGFPERSGGEVSAPND
jgi:hypothetical protein